MTKAPRNKTIELSPRETSAYAKRAIKLNFKSSLDYVLDKTIHQDTLKTLDYLPDVLLLGLEGLPGLLSGGAHDDGHNWPAITVDSRGILHVIANGHHNPVAYTHSLEPDNPYGGWSAPEYVKPGRSTPFLSYATLNCDKNDTLYTIHRSTTDVYNNHLGLFVKPAGKPWQGETTLVTPYRYMYKVWGHKAIYNPATGGITIGFYSYSSMKQLMLDQYLFDIFQNPDHEKIYRGGKNDPGIPEGTRCKMYVSPATELTLLTHDPASHQWKLTTGSDLK